MDDDDSNYRSHISTPLIPLQNLSQQQRSYADSEIGTDANDDRQNGLAISDTSGSRLSVGRHIWRDNDHAARPPRAPMLKNTALKSASRQEEATPTSSVDGIAFQDAMLRSDSALLEQSSVEAPTPASTHIRFSNLRNLDRIENARDEHLLKGKSFHIFSPNSSIRLRLCDLLAHQFTEPFIFALIMLQTILLAVTLGERDIPIGNSQPIKSGFRFGWVIFALFCVYTIELLAKSIVSGFILNSSEDKPINEPVGPRQTLLERWKVYLKTPQTHRGLSTDIAPATITSDTQLPSTLRPFTNGIDDQVQTIGGAKAQRRARLAHRAFLRHSINRVDFTAVCAFWISIILNALPIHAETYVSIFYMLAALRILRLLYLIPGTMAILRNLKTAAPTLLHVASLIGFFWVLFAVIGLQSFKSSFHRNCVFLDPSDPTGSNWTNSFQFCGGWLAENGSTMPWLMQDGELGSNSPKGFICPVQSICLEGENPYNGSVSFDNIFQSLELVFVIMSSRTFSDSLDYLMDSEGLAAAIFFAGSIVVLFFWQRSLVIAVIASSFQIIREGGKMSAFTGQQSKTESSDMPDLSLSNLKKSTLLRIWNRTRLFWIALIAFGLLVQGLRTATMGKTRAVFIDLVETVVTLALLFEITARFLINRRTFFRSKTDILDLILALITTIMQIPPIHNSGQPYAWLTIFQILRIYRVLLASPITRELVLVVLGNIDGLFNLILFVFLLTFLAAVLANQMFHGLVPSVDDYGNLILINFNSIGNSFLGMYQIFSADNWTVILYNLTNFNAFYNTAWVWAIFFVLWFIFANFITMNMFIAVILESFDIDEDEKRLQQVKAFLQEKETKFSLSGTLSLSAVFKYAVVSRGQKSSLALENTADIPLTDAVVKDFLDQQDEPTPPSSPKFEEEAPFWRVGSTTTVQRAGGRVSNWTRDLINRIMGQEPNPFHSGEYTTLAYQDQEPMRNAKEIASARQARAQAKRDYLRKYPKYNVSLFVFNSDNKIRTVCQRLVGPASGGERIEGQSPSLPAWYAFSAFIYLAIIAMVILACITTPLYQKEYFEIHEFSILNWFVYADIGFASLFTIEAFIKIIADGFFFTPNALLRSGWGLLDAVVLITLWINVVAALNDEGKVSRVVGAFKALRALRLLNISESTTDHFYALIVRSSPRVVSAAFVSISLLVPSAIYGLNLFVGKMQSCNDFYTGISDLNDCVGEYVASPSNWNILNPRVVSNTYYSFDDFGSSLFTLFQIVSQQGWVDVMWQAIQITAVGRQPAPFSSYGNAAFFVVFNLLGIVFVLALFMSVFMRSYAEQTGVAFLTVEQRSWLELRKQLRDTNPSKRPLPGFGRKTWEEWFYRRAARKTGNWSRLVTGVLIFQLVLLCVEFYPSRVSWDTTRNWIFFVLLFFYIADIVIQVIGLGWAHYRRSAWSLYALVSVSCAWVTSILVLTQTDSEISTRLQKLSLVSITLLLIPRNNQLYKQFKMATASLRLLLYLMVVWSILFLVFAIALTQTFGLTKFNVGESSNVNLRTVPMALILLFRTSVGDGWNNIMEDFANMLPPYCQLGEDFFNGDCGSQVWARFLFTAWHILNVYIFLSLFVAIIYESFAFAYQRSKRLVDVSREEIRRFKEAWAVFDPDGTGFITAEAFSRLLGELCGVFDMRIYEGDFTVRKMVGDCSELRHEYTIDGAYEAPEINIVRLNRRLAELPTDAIQKRRRRTNVFFEEVLASSDPDKGISFTSVLMTLAHYHIINDRKSLRLEEFLRRREKLQRINETINRKHVVGLLETAYWSRKFRDHLRFKRAACMTVAPRFEIPHIFVDDGNYPEDTERGPPNRSP